MIVWRGGIMMMMMMMMTGDDWWSRLWLMIQMMHVFVRQGERGGRHFSNFAHGGTFKGYWYPLVTRSERNFAKIWWSKIFQGRKKHIVNFIAVQGFRSLVRNITIWMEFDRIIVSSVSSKLKVERMLKVMIVILHVRAVKMDFEM